MLVGTQGVVEATVHDVASAARVQKELVAVSSLQGTALRLHVLHFEAKALANSAMAAACRFALKGSAEENPRILLSEVYDAAVKAQELYGEDIHVRIQKALGQHTHFH